jgi:hypothetical protein
VPEPTEDRVDREEVTLTTGSALAGLTGLVEVTGDPVALAHRTAFYATATES